MGIMAPHLPWGGIKKQESSLSVLMGLDMRSDDAAASFWIWAI
jgi:hypothetical protein